MTITKTASVEGIGLHTGASCRVELRPAPRGAGLVFVSKSGQEIRAIASNVAATGRCTVIEENDSRVSTIEHLLSACAGLGVADLQIVMDGPELPIGDGSAALWVEALRGAGAADGSVPTRRLRAPIEQVGMGGSFIAAYPAPTLSITVAIHFEHPMVGTQLARFTDGDDYVTGIAPARTFGFIEEVEQLRASGLALGGALDNALVIYPDRIGSALRFDNELARHKLLDLIGDLYLSGALPCAQIVAVKPSHRMNNQFARTVSTLFEVG